ncbi:hypothetical protein [Pseudomonas monteilii]|uniref:hypothetical protein n=1 Tax=Pseudomonas monteilii TaxID=76759 RepID=UPI001CBBA74D|nr:hypothetical protein [Pseudomonas monteilii]MBZ3666624.1 hypothetical protein [Pseudomonas monteilii]MBZ3671949.1 hypothetical protein [Pseudomonas monteilii]
MTIDKQKLKALAEAARDYSGSDLIEHESRYNALACEVDPVTVLTLLAEIERHEAWRTAFLAERDAQMRQRDQLRAENEGLRKALLEASEEVATWGAYASEYFQEKHDLAGCVAKIHAAAMAKEASHDHE